MSARRSLPVPKRRRFEEAHKKMFDTMDSIDVAEEKKRLRQQQFESVVPVAIKRLATPKAQRVRAKSVDVRERSKAAKPMGSSTGSKPLGLPKIKVDIKQRAMASRKSPTKASTELKDASKPRTDFEDLQRPGTAKRNPLVETQPSRSSTVPYIQLESGAIVSLEKVTLREPYKPMSNFSVLE